MAQAHNKISSIKLKLKGNKGRKITTGKLKYTKIWCSVNYRHVKQNHINDLN